MAGYVRDFFPEEDGFLTASTAAASMVDETRDNNTYAGNGYNYTQDASRQVQDGYFKRDVFGVRGE